MKHKLIVLFAAAVSLIGVRAYAHHSFAATYFEDQKVTVHGKLVQFLYRNPHSFVHVEAPDEKGDADLGNRMGSRWPVGPAGRNPRDFEARR